MSEYIIKAIKKDPKEWSSKFGPMVTYLIQVEGNGEPVQLNKKADSPAPKVGDELIGEIQDTEYGQKFKSEYKARGGGYQKSPEQEEQIARAVALKAAVEFAGSTHDDEDLVLNTADVFLAWLKNEAVLQPIEGLGKPEEESNVKKKAEKWKESPPSGASDTVWENKTETDLNEIFKET